MTGGTEVLLVVLCLWSCLGSPQFARDIHLIFDNCLEYNGEDSEYAELAKSMKELFEQLMKKHLGDGGEGEAEQSTKKKKKNGSRSPSKTPELTSESSSEEESESE